MNRRTNPPDYPSERMVPLSYLNHTRRRRFAPPAMFSNPGGNFRERTRVMCGRDDNVFLRHQYSLRYCNILDFLLKIVGL